VKAVGIASFARTGFVPWVRQVLRVHAHSELMNV